MPSPSDTNGAPLDSNLPAVAALADPWARRPLVLDGPLERTSVDPATLGFVTGLLGLGAAFVLFQFFITPIVLVVQIVLSEGGMSSLGAMSDPDQLLDAYTRELILSNSIGQVLGLAVPSLLAARLHSQQLFSYLRIRRVDGRLLLLAAVGIVGLQPVVQWLAQINQALPLPEGMQMLEESQLEMIQKVLESNLGLGFNVVMMALVPALCEEVLFRGYAQRQFERASGAAGGILLSGVLFGVYHLRPSQVLPLIVIGLFLAYLTWRTGSLWPAILVHLLHNGIAVGLAHVAQRRSDLSMENLETMPVPWYAVLGGFVIVGGVLYVLHPLARRLKSR
ncbi:MAG: type II CAAX prenyl endopeptidase Rce1 family protein [Salinivenus sp.]